MKIVNIYSGVLIPNEKGRALGSIYLFVDNIRIFILTLLLRRIFNVKPFVAEVTVD
jgi:hypothetical protein